MLFRSGFPLAARHAFDAAPHDLGDVGPFVDAEGEHRRGHAVKLPLGGKGEGDRLPQDGGRGTERLLHIRDGEQVSGEKIEKEQKDQRRHIADAVDEKPDGENGGPLFSRGQRPERAADEEGKGH